MRYVGARVSQAAQKETPQNYIFYLTFPSIHAYFTFQLYTLGADGLSNHCQCYHAFHIYKDSLSNNVYYIHVCHSSRKVFQQNHIDNYEAYFSEHTAEKYRKNMFAIRYMARRSCNFSICGKSVFLTLFTITIIKCALQR